MLNLNFNPFPILSTERLVLREIVEADVNELFFLRSDVEVLKYIKKEPAKNKEEALEFIRNVHHWKQINKSIMWGITLNNEPTLIGNICLWNVIPEHFRAEIGYTLHTNYHRKGIMREALIEVVKYGFETMKLHSIEAHINPQNIPSSKLLERCNFVREAYFKEDYSWEGRFYDTAVYSLLTNLSE